MTETPISPSFLFSSNPPPSLVALNANPLLRASVETSLTQQAAYVAEQTATFRGRRSVLIELDEAMHSLDGGVIALEGPPGSGVSTLLAHLAATRPAAFWFAEEDALQGAAALCVQLIGLSGSVLPLAPPAANSDPRVFGQMLDEVASRRSSDEPLVALVDPLSWGSQPRDPLTMEWPRPLPPGLLVISGSQPGGDGAVPGEVRARVVLPSETEEVQHDQEQMLLQAACPGEWVGPLLTAAQGNMLYLRLAYGLVQRGVLDIHDIPALKPGLDALYGAWWSSLAPHGRRLALLLAAAGEAMALEMGAALSGNDPLPLLKAWGPLVQVRQGQVRFAHWSLRSYLARHEHEPLRQMHTEMADLVLAIEPGMGPEGVEEAPAHTSSPSFQAAQSVGSGYVSRQFSRHAALGTPHSRHILLPMVGQRQWIRGQERRSSTLLYAAHDQLWNLGCAADPLVLQEQAQAQAKEAEGAGATALSNLLLRMGRSSILAGTLASLARSLSPDAAVAAFHTALEQGGREAGLRRVLAVVEQLPDGLAKAQVLRQLGEACHAAGMRSSAMRLLSQALDLEEQRVPPSWREQRDRLLVALVLAALAQQDVAAALNISERVGHVEQRGMAETQVVRHLLKRGEIVRARKVAAAIYHENLGAWAQAEVAVAAARAGDGSMAEMVLGDVDTETARAWAHIELACDAAGDNEDEARQRVEQLESPNQRDRGRVRLSEALARAGKDGDALAMAEQIGDVALRVSALLNLRLLLEGLVAMLALEQASAAIEKLTSDEQIPLLTLLAASYAALGHRDKALAATHRLEEGEERDRALSRVAVALVQYGNHREGLAIARSLSDGDERDWTLGELARVLSEGGYWQESQSLALEIEDERERAKTLARLSIALARTDAPLAALWMTRRIEVPAEHARALVLIAPLLVQAGHMTEALRVFEAPEAAEEGKTPRELEPAQQSRYFAAVAVALAEQGHLAQAQDVARRVLLPFEQTRVYLAIAHYAAAHARDRAQACAALGMALRLAVTDRSEAFRLMEQAAPVFGFLGESDVLTRLAAEVVEIDGWW